MKRYPIFHLHTFMALFAAVAFAACSTDRETVPVPAYGSRMPLTLAVSIEGAPAVDATLTRAEKNTMHDLWSTVAFETGDELGFFSKTGGDPDGTGPLINLKMVADSVAGSGGRFRADDGTEINPKDLTASDVHFYFPYYENITDEPGLKLRVEDEDAGDNIKRCIDFLIDEYLSDTALKNDSLSGVIKHAFGELIIMRGNGFDAPGSEKEDYETNKEEYEKITVVMRNPVTHVRIACTPSPWSCSVKLGYDESAAAECDDGNARRWQAWHGDIYGETKDDKGNTTTEGREAWYVILPTLKGDPSIVEYIEIYDNEGNLQKVSVLRLDDKDDSNTDREHEDRDGNYVWASWRYPMEIAMKELVPTVNPYPIVPWEQTDNDITSKRAPGIANATEFNDWITAYNTYLADKRSESHEDALKAYGDLEVDADGEKVWYFYISTDIDFRTGGNTTIPKLQDILDGQSSTLNGHAFSNNTLSNVTRPFVGELTGNGALCNIDFKSPSVTVQAGTTEAGILANKITGGTVTDCNINNGGLIGGTTTAVGIVAGSIEGGTVENCTFSGLVIGASSDAESGYMFGSQTGDPTLRNNNSTNVTFFDINKTDEDD